jgi:hypothetical protein
LDQRSRSNQNLQYGQLAQLVEQRIENPRVLGSIPRLATRIPNARLRHLHQGAHKPPGQTMVSGGVIYFVSRTGNLKIKSYQLAAS